LRLDGGSADPISHHFVMLEEVCRRAWSFDVVHFHCGYLHFPFTRRCGRPAITTLHGRLDLPDLAPLFAAYADLPLTSISDDQRRPLPWANWQATIYHGLPLDLHWLNERPDGYLASLGRVSPEKRVDWAIEIARRAGREIRIAAKVDEIDRPYFEAQIKPLLRLPHVTYLGEINERDKQAFLGNAAALLFPVDWPEPFGLVQIEAMACGTPVIALRRGSVPEVIDDGVSGFVCDDLDQMVEAVHRLPTLSRRGCRQRFETRFSAQRMASDYLRLYARMIDDDDEASERDGRDYRDRRSALHPGHLAAGG
jgi:glycosyltransferase involved in cell wall biosynthesis